MVYECRRIHKQEIPRTTTITCKCPNEVQLIIDTLAAKVSMMSWIKLYVIYDHLENDKEALTFVQYWKDTFSLTVSRFWPLITIQLEKED